MTAHRFALPAGVLAALLWSFASASPTRADDPPPPPPEGGEVLTHGPVHEAFAQPVQYDAEHPLIVPKQAPDPVEESAPDAKPAGDNVLWIPGYWGWDDDRKDFIWISGVWRDAPPGQVWVGGYWNSVAGGYQWTPGFWAAAKQEAVNYLPQPPVSLDVGPNIAQPGPDDFWVPGNWVYVNTRYAWRPGYWTVAQPNWIWAPAHYAWTPGGYVYVEGYWDYALARRGVMFAPIYFAGAEFGRPRRFFYNPAIVIDAGLLTADFFIRPSYGHYYFGDYYGPAYSGWGFHPWISVGFNVGHVGIGIGYDPLFSYYRWDNRRNPQWFAQQQNHFTLLVQHPEERPARTYVKAIAVDNRNFHLAAPLSQVVRTDRNVKFVAVTPQERKEFTTQGRTFQDVSKNRATLETSGPVRGQTARSLNLTPLVKATGGPAVSTGKVSGGNTFEERKPLNTNQNPGGSKTFGNNPTPSGTGGSKTFGNNPNASGAGGSKTTSGGAGSNPGNLLGPGAGGASKTPTPGPTTGRTLPPLPTDSGRGRGNDSRGSDPRGSDSRGSGNKGGSGNGNPNDPNNKGKGGNPNQFPFNGSVQQGTIADDSADRRSGREAGAAVRTTDPIRPLSLAGPSPKLSGGSGPVEAGSSGAVRVKDPIRPLTLVPSTIASGSSRGAAGGSTATGTARSVTDPIKPLQLGGPTRTANGQ